MTPEHPARLRGLYAIADRATLGSDRLADAVEAALAGGAALVQYRDKSGDHDRRTREAAAMVAACRRFGASAIVNDDPQLAKAVDADGVHLGGHDADPRTARATLGTHALVGVSCYDRLERGEAARAAGADYIAFGRLFASTSKPGGPRVEPTLLGQARRVTGLPVCAIGGITAERAPALIAAGADLLAVIGDLFEREDIAGRAAEYVAAFANQPPASS